MIIVSTPFYTLSFAYGFDIVNNLLLLIKKIVKNCRDRLWLRMIFFVKIHLMKRVIYISKKIEAAAKKIKCKLPRSKQKSHACMQKYSRLTERYHDVNIISSLLLLLWFKNCRQNCARWWWWRWYAAAVDIDDSRLFRN